MAEQIRVVIADDEPHALALLRSMLGRHSDLEIVAECQEGVATRRALRDLRPDLAFLDIRMPDLDGFGVVEALEAREWPVLVFVTAYDDHALRAFDVGAVDYLLKPFDEERLDRAVERARGQIGHDRRPRPPELVELIREVLAEPRYLLRVVIQDGERAVLQRVDEVVWFEAQGKYVRVHLPGRSHLTRERMLDLERELDPGAFLRISRSAIVNVEAVREIRSGFGGNYVVVVADGTELTTTATYRDQIHGLLRRRHRS